MKESQIQKQIIDLLKMKGFVTFKVMKANRAGVSDIIACSPTGKFLAVEVKTPKGTLSPLQKYFLRQVDENHGYFVVATSVDDVRAYLDKKQDELGHNYGTLG